jgi:arsenate reductase
MAEGLARSLAAPDVEVASAGTHPDIRGTHWLAIEMLLEKGIDASAHRSKHIDELQGDFDYVITLCDSAAQECPTYPARRARLHWGLTDPAAAGGDPVRERALFREICDEIERRLREWMAKEGLLKKS